MPEYSESLNPDSIEDSSVENGRRREQDLTRTVVGLVSQLEAVQFCHHTLQHNFVIDWQDCHAATCRNSVRLCEAAAQVLGVPRPPTHPSQGRTDEPDAESEQTG